MQRPLRIWTTFALVLTAGADAGLADCEAARDGAAGFRQFAATLEDLRKEVAQLRRTVARLEFDRRRDSIRTLGNELAAIRTEHARLAELERAREQDVRDIEDLLAQSAAPNQLDLESTRSELAVRRAREIAEATDAARVREAELLGRLHTEEQLVQHLNEAWKFTKGAMQ
jgi:hypothetical protein